MTGTGKSHLLAAALLLGGLLTGCADGGGPFQSNAARADAVARQANPPLTKTLINTQGFDIVAYYRQGAPNDPRLAVFIEGDGVAYISRYQRAYDPTPEKPVALQLAARHGMPNILYLARPCQFTGGNKGRNCDSAYWTTHRFAPEAITAMNQALDTYLRHSGAREVTLYGFSGGATVALLLAGQRRDVTAVVTVAGMLDHQAWTSHFGDTPLYGSRNSLEVADALRRLPQRHFIGDRDKQVPPSLTAPFLRRIGLQPEAFITELRDADHDCCWADLWPQLSRMAPVQP